MRAWAVVVAAGRGLRLGLSYNKVLYPLGGRAVLLRTLDALRASECFERVVLVLNGDDEPAFHALMQKEATGDWIGAVVHGGATRQDSVSAGLHAVPADVDIVAVHDAARPFATPELIRGVVDSCARHGSGVAAARVTDTLKQVDEQGVARSTIDRERVRAVQTPQVFLREQLMAAYTRARAEGFKATDDAQVMEWYGVPVRLVESEDAQKNMKLTNKGDIARAEAALFKATQGEPMRIGYGQDAHRLTPGRPLILCGVEIPHETGLDGYSDADAALHALMDAILGALAMGDIGRLFPDDDPQYKGISSMKLLDEVVKRTRERGYTIGNADITIIAQRPKLRDYMPAMTRSVAKALHIPEDRVNIKATTTERMGFEGREEGISAVAVAMLSPNASQ